MDKHIRRLDADLARFENELKEKLEVSGYESTDGRASKSKLGNGEAFIRKETSNNMSMNINILYRGGFPGAPREAWVEGKRKERF